jgi:hypothetical protein
MHRSLFLLPAAVLTGTLGLGCADQQSLTSPNEPVTAEPTTGQLEADRAQNFRVEFGGIPISDPDRNITLIVGIPLSEVPECGGPGAPDAATQHVVITQSEILHVVNRVRQGNLELYDRFDEDGCGLTAADLVGSGKGNATVRFWVQGAETRIAINVTGQIELVDGGRADILALANVFINTETGIFSVHVDKFEVTPMGG